MSQLERGMVDPDRSFLWNLLHYRRSDQTRVWSLRHGAMYRRIMQTHDVFIIAGLFFAVGLVGGLTKLIGKCL